MAQPAMLDEAYDVDPLDDEDLSLFVSDDEVATATHLLRTGQADLASVAGVTDDELEALYAKGLDLLRVGFYQHAARVFFALVRLRRTNGRFIRGLGLAYHYQRLFKWARIIYGQALVMGPDDVIAKALRAECTLLVIGKREAVQELRETLAMQPRNRHDLPYIERAKALYNKLSIYQGE